MERSKITRENRNALADLAFGFVGGYFSELGEWITLSSREEKVRPDETRALKFGEAIGRKAVALTVLAPLAYLAYHAYKNPELHNWM